MIVMAVLLAGCSSKKGGQGRTAPVPVKVMTVSRSADSGSNSYVGTVEESYGSQLSFATLGTVAQVFADEGKAVGKGEVLATLDRATLQNSYDIALSTLHQTRDAYNRLNLLYKKGSLPEIKYRRGSDSACSGSRQASALPARIISRLCAARAPFNWIHIQTNGGCWQ
jgi:membrane fusion protein (multidrug efflux system)